MKQFIYLEETDQFPRKIFLNLRQVTAIDLGKYEDGTDRLKIFLNADPQHYLIKGKDARRLFDEIRIHLTKEGLL